MEKIILISLITIACITSGYFLLSTEDEREGVVYTERFSARVDRVEVVFEHADYRSYKLRTNELMRDGLLSIERGHKTDTDAMVYVLNSEKPEGEQIRYVKLTEEPRHLYLLDSNGDIVSGTPLILEELKR